MNKFNHGYESLCTCPPKYSLSPYLGRCGHQCVYCYSTKFPSFRGQARPNFALLETIESNLQKKIKKLPVMISPATDPYQPIEERYQITRMLLSYLNKYQFPILIFTKSSLVCRDIDELKKANAVVVITVTTLNERKSSFIEPGAPPPKDRIFALKQLCENGITVAARIDPIIPTFNDDEKELGQLIEEFKKIGTKHITVSTLKPVAGFFVNLRTADAELCQNLQQLYEKGTWNNGYKYLPINLRREIIGKVRRIVVDRGGLTFGCCREGFPQLNTSICDGTDYLLGQKQLDLRATSRCPT